MMVSAIMLKLVLTLSLCVTNAQVQQNLAPLAAPECRNAIVQGEAIAQSATYWGLIDNGPVLPTQMNPLYVIHAMDNRGTWTNSLPSSIPSHVTQ